MVKSTKEMTQYGDYGFDVRKAEKYRETLAVEMARYLELFFSEECGSATNKRDIYMSAGYHLLANYGREALYCRRNFWVSDSDDFLEAAEGYLSETLTPALKAAGYSIVLLSSNAKAVIDTVGRIVTIMSFGQITSEKFCVTVGCREVEAIVTETLTASFPAKLPSVIRRMEINRQGSVYAQMKVIKDKKLIRDPAAFWPFLDRDPITTAREFEESDANVLVLYGAPGLGKSQFIREMIKWKEHQEGKVYMADTKAVFQSPLLIPFIHDMADHSWFVTEDGMEMLERRENGNSLMTGLLNAVEGISSGNVKFIISTNLTSLTAVDSAIIRPGRLFDALHFQLLSADQGNAARGAIDLPPVDFGDKEKMTLAEVLNWETAQRVAKLTKTSFL